MGVREVTVRSFPTYLIKDVVYLRVERGKCNKGDKLIAPLENTGCKPASCRGRGFGHLLQVFRRHLKDSSAPRRRFFFLHIYSYIFSAHAVKISNPGHSRSGQFCDILIISHREKNEIRLFWKKAIRNTLKHRVTGRLDTLSRNIENSDPSPCRQGHFRS